MPQAYPNPSKSVLDPCANLPTGDGGGSPQESMPSAVRRRPASSSARGVKHPSISAQSITRRSSESAKEAPSAQPAGEAAEEGWVVGATCEAGIDE